MNTPPIVLITGASLGIGRAIADFLSLQGFRVFGTTRDLSTLQDVPEAITWLALDVRDQNSVEACVQAVLSRTGGRLDVLVNNAGIILFGAVEEPAIEEAKALFETNFFGVLRLNQAVLPVLRRQRSGRILHIGSGAGFAPTPYSAVYSASKHALEGYSESLDHEVRPFGIRVSLVDPGFIKTDMSAHALFARNPLAEYQMERAQVEAFVRKTLAQGPDPKTVAWAVLKAIRDPAPKPRYLVGPSAKLLRFFRTCLPAAWFSAALRRQAGLRG